MHLHTATETAAATGLQLLLLSNLGWKVGNVQSLFRERKSKQERVCHGPHSPTGSSARLPGGVSLLIPVGSVSVSLYSHYAHI
ncbi:hypothetical protein O6P43_019063 [Quillaja saponaria]|uniref:Uncharacterized protein n=1 Tax=Quillaja saponaria TaxID=32244 RepID=A0AAD7PKC6_QUISA|nr:hypothetical protein O6P43_019063 [Quillaja saponaria]